MLSICSNPHGFSLESLEGYIFFSRQVLDFFLGFLFYLAFSFCFFYTTPPEATQGSTEDVLVLLERQAMPYQVCLNLVPFPSVLLPQRSSSKSRWRQERDSIDQQ